MTDDNYKTVVQGQFSEELATALANASIHGVDIDNLVRIEKELHESRPSISEVALRKFATHFRGAYRLNQTMKVANNRLEGAFSVPESLLQNAHVNFGFLAKHDYRMQVPHSDVTITDPELFFETLEHGVSAKNGFSEDSISALQKFDALLSANHIVGEKLWKTAGHNAIIHAMLENPAQIETIKTANETLSEEGGAVLDDDQIVLVENLVRAAAEVKEALTADGISDETTEAISEAMGKELGNYKRMMGSVDERAMKKIEAKLAENPSAVAGQDTHQEGCNPAADKSSGNDVSK